jgi:ABC-type transporter Mla maintaining outer membrane lipid asymmetry ATPase subunit MlaF
MEENELLKLDDVTFISDNQSSLIDVSFTLKRGENMVVFGPENSGVNILCPVIAGLEENFDGEIYFSGRPMKNSDYIEKHEYRKHIGYLQREYGLINNMNVEENISLPLRYHSSKSTSEVAEYVDALINDLQLQHCRNLRPVDLLPSEILKTAFGRSIALDPRLLLIEHSLEGQCLINSQTFINCMKKRAFDRDKSIIFVTYEPERYTDFADILIMLYNGNVVFKGDRDEFYSLKNAYLAQYMSSSVQGPMRII